MNTEVAEAVPAQCFGFAKLSTGMQEIVTRAKRAGAAEEIASLLLDHAHKAFAKTEDAKAQALRDASALVAQWGCNERQVQSQLEKKHGRYDG